MRHAAPPPGLLPGAVRGSLGGGGAAGQAEPRSVQSVLHANPGRRGLHA